MENSLNKTQNVAFEKLSLSNAEWKAVGISFLIVLISKGIALWPVAYSIDDYISLQNLVPADASMLIANGRFGFAWLSQIFFLTWAGATVTNTLYEFLIIFAQIFMGLAACRIWRISDNTALGVITILFIAIHPYQAEILTFKSATAYVAVSIFLSMTAIYYSQARLVTFIWTSVVFMFALSIYQLALNYAAIILVFAVLLEMLRQVTSSRRNVNLRLAINNVGLWPKIASIVTGLALYLIFNKIVLYLYNINPSFRVSFLPLDFESIVNRLRQLKDVYFTILFLVEPVMPFFVKAVLLLIFLLSFLCVTARLVFSDNSITDRVVSLAVVFSLVLTALFMCVGLMVAAQDFWIPPRVLSGVSIFWAGIVVAVLVCSPKKIYPLLMFLTAVVLFAFVGINNHIFFDQLRVNMRDLQKANRIISAMEARPGFSGVKRVAVIGGFRRYASPILTAQSDMNVSALAVSWAKVYLLNEVSGYKFADASEKEMDEAKGYCALSHKWPDADSVVIKDELGIVCLLDR